MEPFAFLLIATVKRQRPGQDEASAALDAGHVSLMGQEAAWMLLSYKPTEV